MIGEITDTDAKRVAEYKLRRKIYTERSFRLDEREYAESQGWGLARENKTSLRFRKLRTVDEQLENDLWCLLYEFGYPNLNIGRNFQITVIDGEHRTVSKQIDVFAYDNESIIVAECKSAEKRTKKSLQKDLGEFTALQRPIANALRKHLGKFSQKIIWLFVTKNIEWSDNDRTRAEAANIQVITERELAYYKEVAKRVGHSARYQFHAEFLERTKVAALDKVEVFAIRTRLGSHRAFTFFAPARKILPISFVNHRDLRDPEAAPSYQRLIHRQRLKQISEFIAAGGFFPNSVILNFKTKVRFDALRAEDESGVASGVLTLPSSYKSAWIIDGQHRLYGYAEVDAKRQDSLIPFLAFENISIPDETKLFSDINSKQKRVEKKLLDEITGEIKLESADRKEQMRAIASRVFDMMRDDDSGPLGGRITGVEVSQSDNSNITIPYLVDAVINSGLLGRTSKKDGKITFIQGHLYWDKPRDAISNLEELLTEYFALFRQAIPERWDSGKSGKISTNPGVAGSIRFLADLIVFMANKEGEDPRTLHPKIIIERIEQYLEPCLEYLKTASASQIEERFKIPFGSGGPALFQHRLRELVFGRFPDFDAPGFKDDLRKYDTQRTRSADQMVNSIQRSVHAFIVTRLQAIYGKEDYLEAAVENQEILTSAFKKRVEAPKGERKDLATYLDFIDLRRIVEVPKNWAHFQELNIMLPGEKKGKARYVEWFNEINKQRRVSAHPYNRGYSDEDVKNIELIFGQLKDRSIITED